MSVRRRNTDRSLKMVLKYRDLLLWEVTSGNMGTKPVIPIKNEIATFAEKKGLLSEMIKIAELERKNAEDQPEVSGLDMIRKQLNGSGTSGRERDTGGDSEDSPDESPTDTGTDSGSQV